MKVVRVYLMAQLAWTAGIFLLILPITILSAEPGGAAGYLHWLSRALGLAAFPAGIAVAAQVFTGPRTWEQLLPGLGAAAMVGALVFMLDGFVVPSLAGELTLPELAAGLGVNTQGWEKLNDTAWSFYSTLFAPISALLFAAIGMQVGAWARYVVPVGLRRLLYWAVGLGLVVSGYSVFDSTYEAIVLHTAADVSFAAFYTLFIPAALCAGLGLPTLALMRGAGIHGRAD